MLSLGAAAIDRNDYSPTIPASDGKTLSILQGNTIAAISSIEMPVKRTEMPLGTILTNYPTRLPTNGVLAVAGDYTDEIRKLIQCESGGKSKCVVDINGELSCGILQFQKPTYYAFCSGDWLLPENQIRCAAKMISMGLGSKPIGWYNCWRTVGLPI